MLCPSALATGVLQERMGFPSSSTGHAQHRPSAQPKLAPLIRKLSSSTYNSGVDGASTSTLAFRPLTCSANVGIGVSSQRLVSQVSVTRVRMMGSVNQRAVQKSG